MPDLGIERAAAEFYAAFNQLLQGEREPMLEAWSHGPDVTCLAHAQSPLFGWEAVAAFWDEQLRKRLSGSIAPRELLIRISGDMAYTVCEEQGMLRLPGRRGKPLHHHATGIFRREGWCWKLVHYHAAHAS